MDHMIDGSENACMKKKRLLIVNNNMHIGGVQKALLNLLREIEGEYEITLLLLYRGGALLDGIPRGVHVVEAEGAFRLLGMTSQDVASPARKLARGVLAAETRIFGRGFLLRFLYPWQRKLRGFDAAVAYLHSGAPRAFYGGCCEFVLHCVEAEKKYAFLHCDYGKIGADSGYNRRLYRQFDRLAACSAGIRAAFLSYMPDLEERTFVVPNCLNFGAVRAEADRGTALPPSQERIVVTVARLGKEKGVLRAIRAAADLKDRLHYYILGDGVQRAQAEEMIASLGLSRTVELLGEQENPYGYMRTADLLLIPSFSEAAPMVIGEAACLGTPVLTTRTSSAREMVEQTGFGWVCENSTDGIRQGLTYLLEHPEELDRRRAALKQRRFDDGLAKTRFMELME